MEYTKSMMSGMISDYQKMYEAIKSWNEVSPPSRIENGVIVNEECHYIYGMGWTLGDMPFHGWTGDAAKNEWHNFEEVRKAHKALKVALQNALGIEQIEKEF